MRDYSSQATVLGSLDFDAVDPLSESLSERSDFIDIPASSATPASVAIGGSYVGEIEVGGDTDWVRVTLVAGQRYVFSLNGTGGAPLGDPVLQLLNSSGGVLGTDDDGGPGANSQLSYLATVSGTYYLNVAGYNSTYTGQYTLSAAVAAELPTYTPNQIANYLTDGYWNDTGRSRHAFNTSSISFNVEGLTAEGKALAIGAFSTWAAVTGITFVQTSGAAQITLDDAASGAYANYAASGGVTSSATVNVGTAWLSTYGTAINGYSFQTYIHEIGHTLGLGHAGNYNGSAGYSAYGGGDNAYLNDSWQMTVMSYFDQDENTAVNATRAFVVGPMIADIIAIQNLYGTPTNVRADNTTYGFNNTALSVYDFANYTQGNMVAFAIFDSGGVDTLDASGFSANQVINLAPGAYSDIGGEVGNIGIATNTLIENAIGGSGNDGILGSGVANVLRGMGGNDSIMGNAGNDIIFGGEGFDTAYYYYGTGAVIDTRTGLIQDGEGFTDSVDEVEQFVGSGYYRDVFYGNGAVNYFAGYGGNDYIIAADGGADVYNGGGGFDTISYYHGMGSVVNLGAYSAIDGTTGIQQGSTDTIVEIEEVYGSGFYADTIIGDAGANSFYGFGGNDILVGMQGLDSLTGGLGNDLFGFNLADFQAGIWDVISDFSEAADNFDYLYFAGVNPSSLLFGEANGGVYVSTSSLGGTGGFFVAGATQLMISDQLIFA